MFGYHDEFEYFKCSRCGCLQIKSIPENLSRYYPENYYSFSSIIRDDGVLRKLKDLIKVQIIKSRIGRNTITGKILSPFYKKFYWIFKGLCDYNSKILDIGCGNGSLLLELDNLGFKRLKGIDPFISKDIFYNNGIAVLKKQISELDEKFDFIMLHHSFEHMPDPGKVLQNIAACMTEDAWLLIRIPVASGFAFRKYGINWVQLDAPRHLFLHTPRSINILAEQTNLKIIKTIYDSTSFQFTGSIKYENNYTGSQVYEFSAKELRYFEGEANHLNNIQDGDSACFYLQKNKS